jgi:transglycosylase-like protein
MRLRTLGAVCASCAASAPTPLVFADPAAASPVPVTPPLAGSAATGRPPPLGTVAVLATPFVAPGGAYAAVKTRLVDRNVWLKQRHLRLLGERLTRGERSHRREILRLLSAERVAVKNVGLRHAIRELRERLTSAAPDVPIPAQLAAIARCESGGDPRAVSANGTYRGKYQFSIATWRTVGGSGDPAEASETEQDRRAAMLLRRHGAGQWPVCGR